MEAALIINNQDLAATGGATFDRRDPIANQLVTTAATATVADAEAARAAINEFTELRWITIETEPHHYPF